MQKTTILIPVFNDTETVKLLLEQLDNSSIKSGGYLEIILVDDGSFAPIQLDKERQNTWRNIDAIKILTLKRNFGHQIAIAVGLAYIKEKCASNIVIVMDADGEDRPQDINKLIEVHETNPGKIIFARRSKRSEGFVFSVLYRVYKFTFRILTGNTIIFGNFSLIPFSLLEHIIHIPEVWLHYSASIVRYKLPLAATPIERGRRLAGRSKMNFTSLIKHGLSAVVINIEAVMVRCLIGAIILTILSSALITLIIGVRLLSNLAIPGWASTLVALLIIIFLQSVMISLFFVFMTLNSKNAEKAAPIEIYERFIKSETKAYPIS